MGNWGRTPPPPAATVTRDFDRSFILFGKSSSGKSTLVNLVLGRPEFRVHKYQEARGLTQDVQFGDTEIDPSIVYGRDCRRVTEPLKIQMLDQPGSNDFNFSQEKHCKLLMKSIAESKGEMSANFLILINLDSAYLSTEELLTIMNIAEILSNSNYSFFPNAAIVFTHADKIDINMNREELEGRLKKMVKDENFANIDELMILVERRYIFINGANNSEENRIIILKQLFELTRTNLNVYVNGNNGFKGEELKMLLGANPNSKSFRHNLLEYDVEYHFNPDLNLFRKYDKLDIGQEITQALNKLSGIGKGVSVMILLISLEEMFNKEVYNLIPNLPETYRLGEEFRKDFWDYACILFKGPSNDEEFLEGNLEAIPHLRELDKKMKSRYILVNKDNTVEECSNKILELVRRVKVDTEGKTYIDSTVLAEMREIITESAKQRKSTNKVPMTEGIHNLHFIRDDIPIFKMKTGHEVVVKANDFSGVESILQSASEGLF